MALDCDVGLKTVHLIKSKLLTRDCLEEAPRSSRPETIRTFGCVEGMAQSNKDYHMQSINGLTEEFGCLESTMRYQVHN